jgi:Flp pilus assembly protein TadB
VDAALLALLADAAPAAKPVNLWGALGCAVAYSAALLATLDAFADLIMARDDAPARRLTPGVGLKFGSKLAAAAIAVISAGLVLALDSNWFAFTALTIAFAVVVGIGVIVLLRHQRLAERRNPRASE